MAGPVVWVSTDADHKLRTVKVRVDLDNPDGSLRANTFGQGRVVLREEEDAVLVPEEALHVENNTQFLFVRDKDFEFGGKPKLFHVRTVRTGARQRGKVEVIAGVLPDEEVAVKNSNLLMAELLRGRGDPKPDDAKGGDKD